MDQKYYFRFAPIKGDPLNYHWYYVTKRANRKVAANAKRHPSWKECQEAWATETSST